MFKNKVLLLFLVIILFGTGCSLKNHKEIQDTTNETNSNETVKDNDIDEFDRNHNDSVNLSGENYNQNNKEQSKFIFTILWKYGVKIYNDNEYQDYEVSEKGYYFISLDAMKNDFNLDISEISSLDGMSCNTKLSGVYIDPNNVIDTIYIDGKTPVIPSFIY